MRPGRRRGLLLFSIGKSTGNKIQSHLYAVHAQHANMLHMHGAPIGCASTARQRGVSTQRKEKENNERDDISENSETGNDRNSFYDGNGALPAGGFCRGEAGTPESEAGLGRRQPEYPMGYHLLRVLSADGNRGGGRTVRNQNHPLELGVGLFPGAGSVCQAGEGKVHGGWGYGAERHQVPSYEGGGPDLHLQR